MKKVSIIIPTYNESAIIEQTLSTLVCYLDTRFGRAYQLLFVDDGSRDGTADLVAALISEMAKTDPASAAAEGRILSLGYEDNRGKGAAVRYGMLRASGDIRIFTDADLAYGTDVLGAFYDALATHGAPENTADAPRPSVIAIGSRDIHEDGYRGYTAYRRFVSRTYRAILRGFFGLAVSDSQCGIKGFTASAAERIFSVAETNRYAFDFELITLASRAGMPILELPVCVVNNRKSRIRLVRDTTRMLRDLIATKRRLGKK